ncbi:MAG: DUF4405 domain-containing protein [Sedimentisphaerales bacterium]|nr:DUF4405 domain-containing protein [Sedimentisphaerales bacterium]
MRRTTLNFIVDATAFANLLCLAATGIILRFILPPGSGGGHGYGYRGGRGPAEVRALLGLGRHDWGDVHFVLAAVFVILIAVHLFLHWRWIVSCAATILLPSRNAPCGPEDEAQMP